MILKASQRAGAKQLAWHLLNERDNEHVSVHELRGFVADNLVDAFNESYALSRGTRCTQFLFSLSLSPPECESVPVDVFEKAIMDIEAKVGLDGQPRAIVFHEKEGRRHAHCVWSRIDPERMRAINLPHFKVKLRDESRRLYIEHGWRMPAGLIDSAERDPLNFSRAEWQQACRTEQDARALKALFQECWAASDSAAGFMHALDARGLTLARGDRRGVVAVDFRGEVYAVARWASIQTKAVRARFGDGAMLRPVAEVRVQMAARLGEKLTGFADEATREFEEAAAASKPSGAGWSCRSGPSDAISRMCNHVAASKRHAPEASGSEKDCSAFGTGSSVAMLSCDGRTRSRRTRQSGAMPSSVRP